MEIPLIELPFIKKNSKKNMIMEDIQVYIIYLHPGIHRHIEGKSPVWFVQK